MWGFQTDSDSFCIYFLMMYLFTTVGINYSYCNYQVFNVKAERKELTLRIE